MSLNFVLKETPKQVLYGTLFSLTDQDFDDLNSLDAYLAYISENFACPDCGNRRVFGKHIIVEYCVLELFEQERVSGVFGDKWVDKKIGRAYRLTEIYFQNSSFLTPAGFVRCDSCKWEIKGGNNIEWVSIASLVNRGKNQE